MNIPIHKGSILTDIIEVGGYKFFYRKEQLQCATCLMIMSVMASPTNIKGKIRELFISKDCDCPKQK